MINRIFKKEWYQKDPIDRISNKRYSKRHFYSHSSMIRWRIVYPDGSTSEWKYTTEESFFK